MLLFVVYTLHVLASIVWFGGGLTTLLVTSGALGAASPGSRLEVGTRIGERARRVYPIAGAVTIVLGIALPFMLGQFGLSSLATAYGITAIVALVLSLALFVSGATVIAPAVARMIAATDPAERDAAFARAMAVIRAEQAVFVVVFLCMIAMRFGW
ncbi:MAG TPA: hypothetical protein VGC96_04795 [Candidatus Elarobacter sp.]|jgi:uncharacterized membrane protein